MFSPEQDIAYFGGDYDNFTYPRWNFDINFFRIYENGQPLKTPHYLKWSANGAAEGELIFAPGYPGATSRLLTVAQLRYQRDVGNPLQMKVWTARREALLEYQALGAEQHRRGETPRLGLENSIKRLIGQQDGLKNPRIFSKKEDEEARLRAKVAANPEWQKAYAPAWAQIEAAYAALPAMAPRIAFSNLTASRLAGMASTIVRYGDEIAKPSGQRYPEFADARLEGLKSTLFSSAPVYADLEEAQLAALARRRAAGARAERSVREGGPQRRHAGGRGEGRRGGHEAGRRRPRARRSSRAARRRSRRRRIRSSSSRGAWSRSSASCARGRRRRSRASTPSAGEKIARARFAVYGKSVYPDANSNLRFEYGTVLGYELGSTLVPYKTTFYGLYDRAAAFNGKAPFSLPARWRDGKSKLDLSTPFNFVYTADTIGGNSGTPIINRNAEVVGVNFDSNLQKLPNRYMYIDEAEGSRAVGVHSAGIIEGLTKLYGATALVQELTGRRMTSIDARRDDAR